MLLHASGDGKERYGRLQENVRKKTRLPLKKTDKAKQWDVLEKCMLSVKAAEKHVDSFHDLVGCLCFLLSLFVASSYSGTYSDTVYQGV